MTKNNKGRAPGKDATPKTTDSHNHTGINPLIGCFNLVKRTRNRQQNRSWKRSKQRGRVDALLAAQLLLLIVIVLLIGGGGQV